MTKLEKVLIEELGKVSGVDITAIILAATEGVKVQAGTPVPTKPPAKVEAPKTETPKAEAPVKPASESVVNAFQKGDKAARGAIVSLATLAQLREINDTAKIGFDLSKYDDDSLAVARNKVMRWVNRQ